MALSDSVKMMGIWVTTFLLARLQVKKNPWLGRTCSESEVTQCAGSRIVPRSWTCSLSPAPHSHPCAGVHCTWVSFRANSLGGHDVSQTIVMIWVKNNPSQSSSTTKASRLCACTTRHSAPLTQSCAGTEAENCVKVPLSWALKCDWQGTEFKPCRFSHSHAAEFFKSTSHLNNSTGNPWLVLQ